MPADTYLRPGVFTTRVFNPVVAFLARRLGLSTKGARLLSVQGRKTGEWHSTPVNALSTAGQRYLVAPRGETQWVRNIRVSREARLTLGRRTETVHVVEVPDREKPPILRAYLNGRWSAVIRRPLLGVFRRRSRRSARWRRCSPRCPSAARTTPFPARASSTRRPWLRAAPLAGRTRRHSPRRCS